MLFGAHPDSSSAGSFCGVLRRAVLALSSVRSFVRSLVLDGDEHAADGGGGGGGGGVG